MLTTASAPLVACGGQRAGFSPTGRSRQFHRAFRPELAGRRTAATLAVALARGLDPDEPVEGPLVGRRTGRSPEGSAARVAPVLRGSVAVAAAVDDVVR